MTAPNFALRSGAIALILLIALQILWHAWLAPPVHGTPWPALALAVLPLLPGLWVCTTNLRRGVLIGGIVCLFYFCHGIAELWSGGTLRFLPVTELALSLVVIGASGWDARHYKRKARTEG